MCIRDRPCTFLFGLRGGISGVEVATLEVRAIFIDFFVVEGADGFLTGFSESLFLLSEPNRKKDFRLLLLLLKLSNITVLLNGMCGLLHNL